VFPKKANKWQIWSTSKLHFCWTVEKFINRRLYWLFPLTKVQCHWQIIKGPFKPQDKAYSSFNYLCVKFATQCAKDCAPYNCACEYVSHNPWHMLVFCEAQTLPCSNHILTFVPYFCSKLLYVENWVYLHETCKKNLYHFFWLWRPQSLTHMLELNLGQF